MKSMNLVQLQAAYPAVVARSRADAEAVRLRGSAESHARGVKFLAENGGDIAFLGAPDETPSPVTAPSRASVHAAAMLHMTANPGIDYVAAVKAVGGDKPATSPNSAGDVQLSPDQAERVRLDAAARCHMTANPGVSYVAAVKAVGGDKPRPQGKVQLSPDQVERMRLDAEASRYMTANPGVSYLAAFKSVGGK